MKEILLINAIALVMSLSATAQNVYIPDTNFKNYLVGNVAINTNGDTAIQLTEAQIYAGDMDCYGRNIADLTGLEAFTAVTIVDFGNNPFTSIDLSNNIALTTLYLQYNAITSLDLSNNLALKTVHCSSNQIANLNLGNNTVLNFLNCQMNQLTTLDLSVNTALTQLACDNNQLTSLNVANGNNANFTLFLAQNNPNLSCIQVDDTTNSTTNWTGGSFSFDSGTSFSENCLMTNIQKVTTQDIFNIYPNPANSVLNVEVEEEIDITIINLLGKIVATQKLNIGNNSIDVSTFASAIYFLQTSKGEIAQFVKE